MIQFDVEKVLLEIEQSPIEARWRMPRGGERRPGVDLILPYRCFFGRNYLVRKTEGSYVDAGTLRVTDPELRGNGIGERLTRSLGVIACKYGYPKVVAAMASEFSLDIFGRVFGPERMTFYGTDTRTNALAALPISFAEARGTLVAFGAVEPDPEHRNLSIETWVDMQGLNIDGWETPQETTPEHNFDWSLLPNTTIS